jgi:hypothetical protein
MTEFRLDQDAKIDGTHLIGEITLIPRRLVDHFGPPAELDGYKVSGKYSFIDHVGRVYTLCDWKATSLYDDASREGEESSALTPEEFWGNENPDELQIGGRDDCDVEAFKCWLTEHVA